MNRGFAHHISGSSLPAGPQEAGQKDPRTQDWKMAKNNYLSHDYL